METSTELLGYCGLYCADCPAYTGEIADAAKNLSEVLTKFKVEQTAATTFPEEFRDVSKLQKTLEFMGNMRCTTICRQREDTAVSCQIRKCCKEKGFFGCHECAEFEDCDKIRSFMQGSHADACIANLKSIKEQSVETWIEKGNRLWFL